MDRPAPLRIRLVDEPALIRHGMAEMLAHVPSLRLVSPSTPDQLVDLSLYDPRGQEDLEHGAERLAELVAAGSVAVFTWCPSAEVRAWTLGQGAVGCVAKELTAEEMVDALHELAGRVAPGGAVGARTLLTPRELSVLALIAQGRSNQEITEALGLSMNSLKSYIRAIYRKTRVRSRTQAVLWALERDVAVLTAGGHDDSHDSDDSWDAGDDIHDSSEPRGPMLTLRPLPAARPLSEVEGR